MSKVAGIIVLCAVLMGMTSDKPAYQLFNSKGKSVSYKKMLKDMGTADIVFFGESHDNAISHWLEVEVTKDLYAMHGANLSLGAEMFESDQQLLMDEYISGIITKKNFESQARLWPNHSTDYAPLMDFAVAKKIPFVATNIPRRYASVVNKKGFEGLNTLSDHAKMFVAPLPITYDSELPCYKGMLEMMGGHGGPKMKNLPKAQAAKDATMAHFIHKNFSEGQCFLHYNGSYHSQNHEGIIWYLKKLNPNYKIITIHTVSADDISQVAEEEMGLGDYILVVDSDMTRTR